MLLSNTMVIITYTVNFYKNTITGRMAVKG